MSRYVCHLILKRKERFMNISDIINKRHAVKSFDPDRTIELDKIKQLEKILRLSPSSVNLQPWHYIIAGTQEGKKLIAESATGQFAYNRDKILNASLVVVFCSKKSLDDEYLKGLIEQEDKDGRFKDDRAREVQYGVKSGFSDLHRKEFHDPEEWMKRQVYLSAGFFLMGAASLDIDTCPMEGFDSRKLDKLLSLNKRGFESSVIVAAGYRSSDDFNASLPKSRLPSDSVITRI